jgi:serpin B
MDKNINKKISIVTIAAAAIIIAAGIFLFQSDKLITPTAPPAPPTPPPLAPKADDTGATKEGVESIVQANNQFALNLYANLRNKKKGENIFFSPYSISTALAMTYEGARSQTAREIQSVFHIPQDNAVRRSSIAAIYNRLNKKDAKHTLRTANALWAQKDYPFLKEYLNTIEKYYAGHATNVDFAKKTEQARRTINAWVEERTENKIRDLFPKGSLTDLTRLVLTNTIYFKGNWLKQFDKKETREEEFRAGPGRNALVPMMRRTDEKAEFNYAETEELKILEMLYDGKELSMLLLLPKSDNLESLEKSLTLENLNQWKKELKMQRVNVYMPRFTFNSKYFLNENLKEMGMPSAFSPNAADFSGLDGTKELYIQTVVHQAFVDVNEEGTEAAAATGIGVGIVMLPQIPEFRADRPFIFLIQEKETGNILFLGRVINPLL